MYGVDSRVPSGRYQRQYRTSKKRKIKISKGKPRKQRYSHHPKSRYRPDPVEEEYSYGERARAHRSRKLNAYPAQNSNIHGRLIGKYNMDSFDQERTEVIQHAKKYRNAYPNY